MHEEDELNLLVTLFEETTEAFRRQRLSELNALGYPRDVLEGAYGRVWSTEELRLEFEVIGFFAPVVVVKSKADGGLGSMEFQHMPRFYFNFQRDVE